MWRPAAAADLVPAKVKMHIFYGMPKKTKLKTIFAPLCGKSPEQVMAPAVADAHKLGYDKLYRLLLDYVSSAMPRPSPHARVQAVYHKADMLGHYCPSACACKQHTYTTQAAHTYNIDSTCYVTDSCNATPPACLSCTPDLHKMCGWWCCC